ncbi:Ig-like domain-containing protein [Catellatospora sp. NPDC049111]|uniref:COG1470 family protein n=1 Tax=Catellatospora sp. NPDC049111 TaxID=3155271 RepID=UPI0033C9B8E1
MTDKPAPSRAPKPRPSGLRVRVLAAVSAALMLAGLVPATPAHAAPDPYPFPLPNFSHPDSPHAPLFHDRGDTLIPLLVVYATFNDLTTNVTENDIRDRYFPIFQFGTVADYFISHDLGILVPAVESFGTADNGVVVVDLGASGPGIAQDASQRRRRMMDLADPFVDFARYDTDKDGSVEDTELAVATIFTSGPANENCGQTRGVAAGGKLDGKTIAFRTADSATGTNEITIAHELMHQLYDLYDHYGYGVGSWDIAGPTCGAADLWFEPNLFTKLHLGGQKPAVITRDGYHTPSDLSIATTYLLYDYERGTDDYFLVETRNPRPGTYDEDVPDSGVVIFRVDERNVRSPQETVRGVELMRPDGTRSPGCIDEDVDGRTDEDPADGMDNDGDGRTDEDVPENPVSCDGGNDTDAWDPTDNRTPQRTMDRTWADGTPAKVAVRAIGRPFFADTANNVYYNQVYFDVRGPGVLVDPADAQGNAPRPTLVLGSTTDLTYTVRNTGETSDTFDFTELVASTWTATTQRLTLAAQQQATVTIRVTVPADERVGPHSLFARGRSTTDSDVRTDYQFLADVVRRPLSLSYTGVTTVDYSDVAALSAVVRDGITNNPVAGKQVTFTVAGQSLTGTSGADGVATVSRPADQAPGSYPVQVHAPESGPHEAASTDATLTVEPENVTVAVAGSLNQPAGTGQLALQATEEADGRPGDLTRLAARVTLTPTLTGTTKTYDTTFDATGRATVTLDAPADLWRARIEVRGDYFTGPPADAELVLFDPDGSVQGTGRGDDQNGDRVRLTSSLSYQGNSPRGSLRFDEGPRTFTAGTVRWLVVVGDRAVFEVTGQFGGVPAVLRGTAADAGNPGRDGDTFSVRITAATGGALLYESGQVGLDNGNLNVG